METNTARNFALQLGSLIALYVSLSAIIAVLFGVINIAYPDALENYWQYDSAQQGIRFGIAMLIVFFPTYILVTRFVNQIRRRETGTYLTLTKWLVYLSLLVGGGILLGDFVTVILTYLNGEITLRFILKALTLSVVIGAAFFYYILDAKGYWNTHEKHSKMFALGASLVVLAVLVLGFLNSDTPQEARQMRFDQQQIDNLSDMQWRIEDHYQINKSLPEKIDALYIGTDAPMAPEGREAYKYTVIDADTYELCATFAFPSSKSGSDLSRPAVFEDPIKNPYNNWDHGAGETCFERTVVDYSAVKGN
jgi:hypothetical protein